MAEGEAPAPAALIEPDERSTVSLWSSTMRQANKVDEIALILKKMTQLETKLSDLEGERIRVRDCLLYTSPSPRDRQKSRMPSSA